MLFFPDKMSDKLNALRLLDFPKSTNIALAHIDTLLASGRSIPGLGDSQHDLAQKIAQEFVFGQVVSKKRGMYNKLTSLEELHTCNLMMTYISHLEDPSKQQGMFNMLFDTGQDPYRMQMAVKLVSLAIGIQSDQMLNVAATWMQSRGVTKLACTSLVGGLVLDYCQLVPDSVNSLCNTANISPRFTHSFITAATSLYHLTEQAGEASKLPPDTLVSMVTDWVTSDPSLCFPDVHGVVRAAPSRPAGLWNPGLDLEPDNTPESPLPGLINWCVRAPLVYHHKLNNSPDKPTTEDMNKTMMLYSKLHLAVLHTFHLYAKQKEPRNELLKMSHLHHIGSSLHKVFSSQAVTDNDCIGGAVDRLAQSMQVAMATRALRCSKDDVVRITKLLPPNKLLDAISGLTVT